MQEGGVAVPSRAGEEQFAHDAIRSGAILFLAISGGLIAILPFREFSQSLVLVHAAIGVFGLLAVLISWTTQPRATAHIKSLRIRSVVTWLIAATVITGVIVTAQALFGRYVSRVWDWLHLWTGILLLPIILYGFFRKAGARQAAKSLQYPRRLRLIVLTATIALFLFAVSGLLAVTFGSRANRVFTVEQYPGWTFLPSMVGTETGKPLRYERIANSQSCGTADCHAAIYDEWLGSAHRWSGQDEFFQEVRTVTTQVKGVHETEKCAACHDPVSLLTGHKEPNLGLDAPGIPEGDSCVICHAVRRVDNRGIGSYVLGEPTPYLFEDTSGRVPRSLNHFLIRCYPDQHNRDFDLTIVRKPESCAPCHKEYDLLDEGEGPVQVETQFDDWKSGKWNTDSDSSKRLYCQQCHMGLVATSRYAADPYDLKKAWGSRHRNHAFAAANQYMPTAIATHNAKAQVDKAHQWLRGERAVPEIENAWPKGPIVELKLNVPETVRPTEQANFTVTLTNNRVGHMFPTGPLNIARAWVEVVVEDETGKTIFHSGLLDRDFHIEDGSYILKPLAINMGGEKIMKRDLWHPVGPRFRRAILARESDGYDYVLSVPPDAHGPLTVKARLRYSKANQFFMDAVHPVQRRTAPITDISSAVRTIAVSR